MANRTHAAKLQRCRVLLVVPTPQATPSSESAREAMRRITGEAIDRCPACRRGRLWVVAILPCHPSSPPLTPIWDSS